MNGKKDCPDCNDSSINLNRRSFLKTTAVTAAAAAGAGIPIFASPREVEAAPPTNRSTAETAVTALYNSFSADQRRAVCFDWNHRDAQRGILRTHISNNWQITSQRVDSNFFTRQQKGMILDIFRGIIHPEWHARIMQQLRDDTGGRPFGNGQSIAIFGRPGTNQCEFVMTGRHMTIRCDGNTTPHVAFGGPIFYGHAAMGFNERAGHPGNVFWEQARRANLIYRMLNGRQQQQAMVANRPEESAVAFRGRGGQFSGIPVSELSRDQKAEMQRVLRFLLDPYRVEDRDDAMACLRAQGGLDRCHLAFYRDGDIGNDTEWDNWRLEGPAFVWYFRGEPHVHSWVNIADDPSVPLNA